MTRDKLACPQCGGFESGVVRSRPSWDLTAYERERVCVACGNKYRTVEILEPPENPPGAFSIATSSTD